MPYQNNEAQRSMAESQTTVVIGPSTANRSYNRQHQLPFADRTKSPVQGPDDDLRGLRRMHDSNQAQAKMLSRV